MFFPWCMKLTTNKEMCFFFFFCQQIVLKILTKYFFSYLSYSWKRCSHLFTSTSCLKFLFLLQLKTLLGYWQKLAIFQRNLVHHIMTQETPKVAEYGVICVITQLPVPAFVRIQIWLTYPCLRLLLKHCKGLPISACQVNSQVHNNLIYLSVANR